MNRRATVAPRKKPGSVEAEKEPAGKPWLSVRPARIARARKLLRDPDYPQAKVIDSVARLLAKHLGRDLG